MTEPLSRHFTDYAAFHRTAGNRVCHSFGIPIIVLASLALLARVPLFMAFGFTVTLAEALIALFAAYYLTLDAALAGLMLAAYAVLDVAGRFIPPLPALGLFVFGWILQGVGHWVYEKNSPAFFRNFVHLAVGQLWILAKAVGRA
jgi:uncharacterized membrane protein YGL010W